jgi:Zinc knuckle
VKSVQPKVNPEQPSVKSKVHHVDARLVSRVESLWGGRSSRDSRGPKCWTCKEHGHVSRSCPKAGNRQPRLKEDDLRLVIEKLRMKKEEANFSSCLRNFLRMIAGSWTAER